LLRHRLRRRATRRIPRGCWRGRLSRWRRWRRRSLSGCRAGCHHGCQDQKKRFSLHGEQMLPRYRCSLPVGETDWRIRSISPQDSFRRRARCWAAFRPQSAPAGFLESWRATSDPAKAGDNVVELRAG
jgi:hypothetical protein